MNIIIPISPGELLDRITILQIKSREITDPFKLKNVRHELETLSQKAKKIPKNDKIVMLQKELFKANGRIWNSENAVRKHWNNPESFVEAARESHFYNDERSRIKREINEILGTDIVEEKSHPSYEYKK